jgi:DNA-binding response OmpR family regulator
MRYTVLVVDDNEDSRSLYRKILEGAGHSVLVSDTGRAGLVRAVESKPDVVLADVRMPGMDGIELCRLIKKDPRCSMIPVILCSGLRMAEKDHLAGLLAGADDYILKPFSRTLLIAKIEAAVRRSVVPANAGEIFKVNGLTLDVQSRTLYVRKKAIQLTRKEFDLLTAFLRKPGRLLSIHHLLQNVWGIDPAAYNDPRSVVVHVSSLRRKLGRRLGARILTVSGSGYRFLPPERSRSKKA